MANTTNFNFELIDFDTIPWHTKEHDTWRLADAVFAQYIAIAGIKGIWDNALTIAVADKYVDRELGTIHTALIAHTSASSGTFADDRTANASFWESFSLEQAFRGTWATGRAYAVSEFVVDGHRYAVCQTAHTSTTSFDTDTANWLTLIDTTASVTAAASSATDAATSATAAAASVGAVKVSANDTTAGILNGKLVAGTNVTFTEGSDGGDETLTIASTDTGLVDPLTTRGDVIIRGASATGRLAVGAANTVLKTDGTDPSWGTVATDNIAADAVTVAKLAGGVLTDGYAGTDFDLGTNASGTETLDYTNGNFQKGVNGGAHTLAPQVTTSTIIVQYTNDGSAGTLTTSGYTIVTGDSLTTTSGHDFMMYSTRVNSFKHLHIVALQ